MLKRQNAEKLMRLTAIDLQDDAVRQLCSSLENNCCSFCGEKIELRKREKEDEAEIELVPFCPRCKSTSCAIEINLYLNKLSLWVQDTLRTM